jgi:hypothetical protein
VADAARHAIALLDDNSAVSDPPSIRAGIRRICGRFVRDRTLVDERGLHDFTDAVTRCTPVTLAQIRRVYISKLDVCNAFQYVVRVQ